MEFITIGGFTFKAVATGQIVFKEGFPLTGKAVGAKTLTTLRVENFPDDVKAADLEVSIGGLLVPSVESLSVQELTAKISFVVPDDSSCLTGNCIKEGYVSIPSRNLQTLPGFNFTYIAEDPPIIKSFYPQKGTTAGGESIVFYVSNLDTDPSTGQYQHSLSSLTFDFGGSSVQAASTQRGSLEGTLAIHVSSPAHTSGDMAKQITFHVSDPKFNQSVIAPLNFEYYDNNPFVELVSPAKSTAGISTEFEIHIGNWANSWVLSVPNTALTVVLCSTSHSATHEMKTSDSVKTWKVV